MKIFEHSGDIIFIDEVNDVLRFDLSPNCCEYANWFISDKIEHNIKVIDHSLYFYSGKREVDFYQPTELDLVYRFARKDSPIDVKANGLDEGSMVAFKIIDQFRKEKPDLYIHLFNSHNGYYGHEYRLLSMDSEKACEGYL